MKIKLLFFIIFLSISFFLSLDVSAIKPKNDYPRLANYFLKWEISNQEVIELAQWDLLILDMELQRNSPDKLVEIRKLNPDIIILAYITAQEIIDRVNRFPNASLRQDLYQGLIDNWYLRDGEGNQVVYWPGTFMLNVSDGAGLNDQGERFNDYLPRFVAEKIKSSRLWDGVFYDNTWGDVAWVNDGNLDIENNGQIYKSNEIDQIWARGFTKILKKTRELAGDDFIIVGNGRVHAPYLPHLHGMMLEGFPSYWESGGTWEGSVATYLALTEKTRLPSLPIINTYHKDRTNYQIFRFGLTSTLLGEGYYSFDYDVTDHSQTWWYDEYEVNLGQAQSGPYNLLDLSNSSLQAGLWRRDFNNGSVILNSSQDKQRLIFEREIFEKISGSQDQEVNSGERINWLELAPRDGIVLLKEMTVVLKTAFTNGEFVRIFNQQGKQVRSGFFSYLNNFPGSSQILLHDLNQDGQLEQIVAFDGLVNVYKNGQEILSFQPFHEGFRGKISLAVADLNNNGQLEIITGAGPGGGPQVRIFNTAGRLVSTFFAYDPNFRGGIDVAAGDINANGQAEIITGAGPGGGPHIRVFDYRGRELSTFFAYESDFRGGVNVSSGDINGNGRAEIIAGPGPGRAAELRYFNHLGELTGSFLAVDQPYDQGINIAAFDALADNLAEIVVGLKDF